MRHKGICGTTIALVALLCMVAGSQAQAAATPKLSGYAKTPVLSQGEKLELEITARAAKAKTAKTKLALLLSSDKRESKKDLPLKGQVKVPALAKRKSKTITKSFSLPSKAKPDGYYVLACAGDAKCKSLGGTVGVTPRAEPVNVTLEPDNSRQVSQLVTRAGGGRLEATAADGTRYALVLPPGSVPADQLITMTPLAGVQGLPFDGLAAGVKLEPAGLPLDEPAKLLMQRDGLTVSPGTAAFGSHDGQDLFLAPWTTPPPGESLGDGTVAVGITHFSGWGAVSLNQTQMGSQWARSARSAQDRIAQDVQKAITESGTGFLDEATLSKIGKDYTEQVVRPLLEAAIQDPVFLDDAVRAYLGLERQLQLLGKPEGFPDDPAIANLFKRAFMRYVQVLKARCAQADFTTIAEAVSLARQMDLLAGMLPGVNGPPQSLSEALELLEPCLRFELRMRSSFQYQDNYTYSATLLATVQLRLQGQQLIGEGPVDYASTPSYNGEIPDCTYEVIGTEGSTMKAEGGANLFQLSATAPGKPPVVTPQASFMISPGMPTERIRETCDNSPDPPTVTEFQLGLWPAGFVACTHTDPGKTAYLPLDNFKATGTPGVIATREYIGAFGCGEGNAAAQVNETWELVHTPET